MNFYETYLRDFLPDRIVDCHSHVWCQSMLSPDPLALSRTPAWPWRVAKDNPVEDLIETYKLLFPGKQVSPWIFSHIIAKDNLDILNGYVSQCAAKHDFASLAITLPDWDPQTFETVITEGGFLGAKPYPTFSPSHIPSDEIQIFDFVPHRQLQVLDRNGWILLLHLPRPARLKDPLNLTQLLEIENRYPNIKLIVAHIGRAYCLENVGNAFEILADAKKMLFDISANTNTQTMHALIEAVGPRRILFGSDLPPARARLRRICQGENYVNLVPKGLYGNVSTDEKMREVEGEEAEKLTFFLYEEIDAFRRASLAAKLTQRDLQEVFCNNASRMIRSLK